MKTIFCLTTILLLLSFTFSLQDDCETYYPIEKGMKWEYEDFDKNGKLRGYSLTEVIATKEITTGIEYTMKIATDDAKKKEKNHFEREMTFTCENGVLKMNLEGMIPTETLEGLESMTIDIDQTEMTIPKVLVAGQTLDDAAINIKAEMSGMTMMDMNILISDRKVEKMEMVTTEAGTYNCALITYKTTTKMSFMNTISTSKDWFSPEVGIVKSEYYDKNGALDGIRKLTGYSK